MIPTDFDFNNIESYKRFKKKEGFLSYCIDEYSKVEPVQIDGKYNFTETLRQCNYSGNLASNQLQKLVVCISDITRSTFIATMTKKPQYASMTPLFLWAQKNARGILYEAWDKTDPNMEIALGAFLSPIISFAKSTAEDLHDGKTIRAGMTNLKAFRSAGCTVEKPMRYMITQTWLCHPHIRVPEMMILDPWNWDNTPEPMEIVREDVKDIHRVNPFDDKDVIYSRTIEEGIPTQKREVGVIPELKRGELPY